MKNLKRDKVFITEIIKTMKSTLEKLCKEKIVKQIITLPPLLRDDILKISTENMKRELRSSIINEIKNDMYCTIDDLRYIISNSKRTGETWHRPSHTLDMDDDLFQICVEIVQNDNNYNDEDILGEAEPFEEYDTLGEAGPFDEDPFGNMFQDDNDY